MELDLIVDVLHTIAIVSLGYLAFSSKREHESLIKYIAIVARNPMKARKTSFEKFKNSEKK